MLSSDPLPLTGRFLPALLLLAALSVSGAGAQGVARAEESSWIKATDSKVRLIGGTLDVQGQDTILAGVQIRMDAGWKTYWRNPGDSGVPPSFDWSGSKNLKHAEVLYPAPRRFADAAGAAIGYVDEVVFPVKITPERPGAPVELKLNLTYGLCKDLCIPNEVSLSLALPSGQAEGQGEAPLLKRFLDLVPKPAEAGALPAVSGVQAKLDGPQPQIAIDTQFPADAQGGDLFIEAGDAFVPVPKPAGPLADGKQRFIATFDSAAEAAKIKGKPLTLTLVYDGGARATTWTVE
jgi:DsbC/DsbD-like thiol-disulfide interchange protein